MAPRFSLILIYLLMLAGSAIGQSDPPQTTDRPPFTVIEIDLQNAEGEPIRGWLGKVDLSFPGLEVVVTEPLETPAEDEQTEAILTPTDQWAREQGLTLAVNANFYGIVDRRTRAADVMGLSISDGEVVSPPRAYEGVNDPAVVFNRHGKARVLVPPPGFDFGVVHDGVAGIGASPNDPDRHGLIVLNSENHGATARVAPEVRHPRTAVGVDRKGDTLFLLVIDGRQPEWSVGVTLPELAEILIEHGADDALILDGGGSSTFIYVPDGQDPEAPNGPITNRPSDGQFRAVANHLGFRLDPTAR